MGDSGLNVDEDSTVVGDAQEQGRGFQQRGPNVMSLTTTQEFKIKTTYNNRHELKEQVNKFSFHNLYNASFNAYHVTCCSRFKKPVESFQKEEG